MGETSKILVVDDEIPLLETLEYNLKKEGYEVFKGTDGLQALALAEAHVPDLIVLDLMLPQMDGLSVCRTLRRDGVSVPIIMLTARAGEVDKIVGLDSGADDYITKPFSLGEFMARVRAALRRTPLTAKDRLTSGNLTLDLISRRATLDEQEVTLSHKEFDLLAELMRHRGAVLTRESLLERVWGFDFYGDSRTVDVHIRWLRSKVEIDPSNPERIQTVRGVGYRFEE
ncbi:MAG: response regulator transcription factor [Chloroflexi bacterium]|nr:response regulator transcription factor [Chloroflexota bacterium]